MIEEKSLGETARKKSRIDDRGYNQLWHDSKATRIRTQRRGDHILAEMDLKDGKSILEIGCGTGGNAFYMAQKTALEVTGIDICIPYIDEANETYKLPNLQYQALDFNKIDDFIDARYDYIVGNGILHHLYYNLDSCLVNIRALLTEKGKIIFYEPNLYNPYVAAIFSIPFLRKLAKLEPAEMAFTRPFMKAKLKKAGFQNINISYRDFLLPGIPNFLIKPSIIIGDFVEKIPPLNRVTQSLFIVAEK